MLSGYLISSFFSSCPQVIKNLVYLSKFVVILSCRPGTKIRRETVDMNISDEEDVGGGSESEGDYEVDGSVGDEEDESVGDDEGEAEQREPEVVTVDSSDEEGDEGPRHLDDLSSRAGERTAEDLELPEPFDMEDDEDKTDEDKNFKPEKGESAETKKTQLRARELEAMAAFVQASAKRNAGQAGRKRKISESGNESDEDEEEEVSHGLDKYLTIEWLAKKMRKEAHLEVVQRRYDDMRVSNGSEILFILICSLPAIAKTSNSNFSLMHLHYMENRHEYERIPRQL